MRFTNKINEKMATNPKLFEIANTLTKLTVLEAKELINILENDYGIKPATQNVIGLNTLALTEKVSEPEQTEFDAILKEIGTQKLKLIVKIKELKNLTLIEAKTLVESAPCKVLEKVSKENATQFKTELEILGATIEIK
jgi:large subunit ribosomal protein L7/L12